MQWKESRNLCGGSHESLVGIDGKPYNAKVRSLTMPNDQWTEALDEMPTLRDHYAMAALTGLLANRGIDIALAMQSENSDLIPRTAFMLANSMLYFRNETNNA